MSNWLKAKTENIKKIIDAVGRGFASVRNKFTNWWTGNDATIAENKNKDPEDVNNWDRITDKITTGVQEVIKAIQDDLKNRRYPIPTYNDTPTIFD